MLKQRQSTATILHVATTANQGSTTTNQGAISDKDEAKVTDDRASANADLTIKVVLMIGSQLLCWISFFLTVLYRVSINSVQTLKFAKKFRKEHMYFFLLFQRQYRWEICFRLLPYKKHFFVSVLLEFYLEAQFSRKCLSLESSSWR